MLHPNKLILNLESDCLAIAIEAHRDQIRDDGKPYILHPIRVAGLLAEFGCSNYITRCIAYLHDVVEDCPDYSLDAIRKFLEFNSSSLQTEINQILLSIKLLTKVPSKEDKIISNKNYYEEIFKKNPSEAAIVKLCDRIDNLTDAIGVWNHKRLVKYAEASKLILEYSKGHNTLARQHLNNLIEDIIKA